MHWQFFTKALTLTQVKMYRNEHKATNLFEPLVSWIVVILSAFPCSPLLISLAQISHYKVAPYALSNHIWVPFPVCTAVFEFSERFRSFVLRYIHIKIILNANSQLNDDWWMESADFLDRKIEIDKVVGM